MAKQQGRYAWTAKVGEKGQIVIPKEARDLFGISPGDTLFLLGEEGRGIAIMKSELIAKLTQDLLSARQNDEKK